MGKQNFPYIALFLGMMFMLAVTFGGQVNGAINNTRLPLLILLIISEVAFILTAIAAYLSIKQMYAEGFDVKMMIVSVLCVISAITFLVKGISFWPL